MKIEREKLNVEGVDGLVYWIVYDEPNRPNGKVQILFKKVSTDEFSEDNYQTLKDWGLENSIVAYVDSFYPHGYPHDEKYFKFTRKGLGSKLLQEVIKDVKERGIEAICDFDCSESMKGLFLKNNFIYEKRKSDSYYLKI